MDQFYVGSQRNDAAGPHGQSPERQVSILNMDLIYGLTNRFSVGVTVPFVSGYAESLQGAPGSPKPYRYDQGGLGDVSIETEYWLSDPTTPSRVEGSVGFGVKTPTGNYTATGLFYSPEGEVRRPLDEGVQLGSGGWEILLRAQGSARDWRSIRRVWICLLWIEFERTRRRHERYRASECARHLFGSLGCGLS